jgi:hypothetical protein
MMTPVRGIRRCRFCIEQRSLQNLDLRARPSAPTGVDRDQRRPLVRRIQSLTPWNACLAALPIRNAAPLNGVGRFYAAIRTLPVESHQSFRRLEWAASLLSSSAARICPR